VRILLTVHQFFPDYATGTEVLTLHVAREFEKIGHEVRIVTGYPIKNGLKLKTCVDQYYYQGLRVERYYHQEAAVVGEQSNVVELEYDNHLFSNWLRQYLGDWRPDIVHFFHLKNLSATCIEICHDLGIPMVLTPTDFWLVCPTNQLLLHDGSLCKGPDAHGVNCLQHVVHNTQSSVVKIFFQFIPDRLLASSIRISSAPLLAIHPPFSWVSALGKRIEFIRQRVKNIDCILAPTRFMEKVLVSNGMLPREVVYSQFGIDLTGFTSTRRGSAGVLRVGFIGSLLHHKGAHVLVDAVRQISVDHPLEVQIYGDPSVSADYVEKIHELAGNDSRINFLGTFPSEDIGKIFANIDVLVVPSLWVENTPLVMYSAQAAGCPIVASNLDGMSEVIRSGIDGLLFPPGNSKALASILEELCMKSGMVNKLAENSPRPKSISEYSIELLNIYQQVILRRNQSE